MSSAPSSPPSSSAPRDPASRRAIQRAIQRRIREFDATALLDLLDHLGYSVESIAFRGYLSRAPQPSLFQDIAFLDEADLVGVADGAEEIDVVDFDAAVTDVGVDDDVVTEVMEVMEADVDDFDLSDFDDVEFEGADFEVTVVGPASVSGPAGAGAQSQGADDRAHSAAPTVDVSLDATLDAAVDAAVDAVVDAGLDEALDGERGEALDETRVYGASASEPPAPADAQTQQWEVPLEPLTRPIESILSSRAGARVIVTVNLGLVSCRSPLSSYVLQLLTELDTRDALLELLAFVDDDLLRARLTSDRPDRVFANWLGAERDLLEIFGLASPFGLDWLFRHVFPELGVSVRRSASDHHLPAVAARVGYAVLGRAAFGSVSTIPIADLEVTLICAEARSLADVPWIEEAEARLRTQVLPVLATSCLHLTVVLLLLDQTTYARIAPDSYVGYDAMRGGSEKPRRIVLFQGALIDEREESMPGMSARG